MPVALNKNNENSIFLAVKSGNLNTLKYLFDQGADCIVRDEYQNTPLHFAFYYKDNPSTFKIVKYLVEKGCSVNAKNYKMQIPLHLAARSNLETVKYLIDQNADVNARDKYQNTPLHFAFDYEDKPTIFGIVKYLVEKGSSVNAKNEYGETPLHLAAKRNLETVKYLINKGANINANDEDQETPLHYALWNGDNSSIFSIVKYLVEKGCLVNAKSKYGETPLHLAAKSNLESVKYLIDKGADFNAINDEKYTPLHFAFWNQDDSSTFEIVKYLVENGCSINAKNEYGKTPLHLAAKSNLECVKYLIDKGADVNAKDEDGYAPLHYAKDEETKSYLRPKRSTRSLKRIDNIFQRPMETNTKTYHNKISGVLDAGCLKNFKSSFRELNSAVKETDKAPQIGVSSPFFRTENLAFIGCIAETLDKSASKNYEQLKSQGINVIPNINAAVCDAHRKFQKFVEEKISSLKLDVQAKIQEELEVVDSDIVESFMRGVQFSGFIGLDNVLEECKRCFENNILKIAIHGDEI